jgi:hypothetical protein
MSGIAKSIGKVFKKIKPLIKPAITAVAIYYTAGAAMSAFAAPAAGAATTASATTWGSTLGGTSAVGGAGGLGITSASAGAVSGAGAVAGSGSGASAFGSTLNASAGSAAVNAGNVVANTVGNEVVKKTAETGMMGWLQANPMAAMMVGQGVAGIASADAESDMMDRQEASKKDRGLMGFNYDGSSGVVNRQMNNPPPANNNSASTSPTTNAPVVAGQQVATNQVQNQNQNRPIPRDQLPDMNKRGEFA